MTKAKEKRTSQRHSSEKKEQNKTKALLEMVGRYRHGVEGDREEGKRMRKAVGYIVIFVSVSLSPLFFFVPFFSPGGGGRRRRGCWKGGKRKDSSQAKVGAVVERERGAERDIGVGLCHRKCFPRAA